MTGEQLTLNGTILPDGTLQLPGPVSLPPGPVEVIVRVTQADTKKESILEVLSRIDRERAAIAGYQPRTAAEIDASIEALRDEWEERQIHPE